MPIELTAAERAYLASQRLGRLATVSSTGQPYNKPVGFFVDDDRGVIDIGGARIAKTAKWRHVQANPQVSLVVDDLASVRPWRVRGVEIRGRAELIVDWEPPFAGFSRQAIRIHPERVVSWGLDDVPAAMNDGTGGVDAEARDG
jgi:pyridoxamine 5'-phosphate oxidase family protein